MPAGPSGRRSLSLDGLWDFVHADDGRRRQAPVPMPWQAAFADLRQTSGQATYSRRFAPIPGDRLFLQFGAASYFATVRVNGRELARHDGGWLPFAVELPPDLIRPDNLVEVDCLLPDGQPDTSPGAPFAEIPHGKQSWYGPAGGLWQSVHLESRPARHLTHVAITADPTTGRVTATLDIVGSGTADLSVLDSADRVVAKGPDLMVPDPALWHPDAPHLYRLRVDLGADVTEHVFGFRRIETRDGKLLLNGAPFYMRGALDQDYWPVGLQTPPSLAALENQARKAKALGLNTLRCHIKVPDPRYYDVADRLGLLIWTEIPNVGLLTDASARRIRETMTGILHRDGNHPSICIWSILNEDWGTRLSEDPAHRAWLRAEYDWLKARDPSRLVVDNSPCHNNFHVKTDINDFHWYRSLPERRAEWDALTAEFAAGADWTFTPHGDGERRGDEPLICSEFGVWGLPQPADVQLDGAEPWWMESGQTWGDGAAYPHGMAQRFAGLGLGRVFGDLPGFVAAAQGYQEMNLKAQIESLRSHASIQGYVVTEFTDVHWESNGLLDMNRNPRPFAARLARVNADVVILPRVDRHAAWAGQPFTLGLSVAAGGQPVPGGHLRWSCGPSTGQIPVPPCHPCDVVDCGILTLTMPESARNSLQTIWLTLWVGDHQVAENQVDIALYAPGRPGQLPVLDIPDDRLATWFSGRGYPIAPGGLRVVPALNADDVGRMQGGARYLVLADGAVKTQGNLRVDIPEREQPHIPIVDDRPGLPRSADALMPNITLTARHGTLWRGDWIAGFSWIRRDGPFAAIPGGPLLDLSFDRVVPQHVMGGFRPWEYGGDVHAGLVVGWCHKPAALIAERTVGGGHMVATTFRLTTDAPGADPVAAGLADALIALAQP